MNSLRPSHLVICLVLVAATVVLLATGVNAGAYLVFAFCGLMMGAMMLMMMRAGGGSRD